jgi:hypothetical protein
MKKLIRQSLLIFLGVGAAFGQLVTTQTTLSVAIPTTTVLAAPTTVSLNSCTGTVLPSLAGNTVGSYLGVDQEFMQVESLLTGTIGGSGACTLGVKRGLLGSVAAGHSTVSYVFVGNAATGSGDNSRPFTGGPFVTRAPSGACTASLQYSLPVVVTGLSDATNAGYVYGCVGGVWTGGPVSYPSGQPINVQTPITGHGFVTSPQTDVADISGQEWFSEIYVSAPFLSTGAGFLAGTGATDHVLSILWDSTGAVVANSALAGAVPTASIFNYEAWTSTTWVYPGLYYVGIQGNGTTAALFWTYGTGDVPKNFQTGIVAAGTFGTVIKIPTANLGSFTTAEGPIMQLY